MEIALRQLPGRRYLTSLRSFGCAFLKTAALLVNSLQFALQNLVKAGNIINRCAHKVRQLIIHPLQELCFIMLVYSLSSIKLTTVVFHQLFTYRSANRQTTNRPVLYRSVGSLLRPETLPNQNHSAYPMNPKHLWPVQAAFPRQVLPA